MCEQPKEVGEGNTILSNGVSAETGRPLPAVTIETILLAGAAIPRENVTAAHTYENIDTNSGLHTKGVVVDVDIDDLAKAGWGIVFPQGKDTTEVLKQLRPLIDLRKAQAGSKFHMFEGENGVSPGEEVSTWLGRQGLGPGIEAVDPDNGVPFYLLIVADPTEIAFEFQYLLDLFWAVGRLHFDELEAYGRYAASVVAFETDGPKHSTDPTAAIFATSHPFDLATKLFSTDVAGPFANGTATKKSIVDGLGYELISLLGDSAKKQALTDLLSGKNPKGPPTVLLTGTHGMVFKPEDPQLGACNGALVCQDWEGYGKITNAEWFCAEDVPRDAKIHGLIHILFACYGGGWSVFDTFRDSADGVAAKIAPSPGIAKLPQTLLSHPEGGALAILAHVDRAWSYSFRTEANNPQNTGLYDVMRRILLGERVGVATDQFNQRWTGPAIRLSDLLRNRAVAEAQTSLVARLWVMRDDARNYVILGDPSVRAAKGSSATTQ